MISTAEANGIELAYETFGDRGGRPLLLVMGLGTQMLAWHDDLCAELAGRGFFVVRYDNRDAGLSTHLHDAPPPDLMAALTAGDTSSASYTLDDLADDAAGLLDALGIDAAHVVGVSMGGIVAQVLAVRHPARVRSLTSVMSTPSPSVGAPTQEATAVLLAPPATSREAAAERAVAGYRVIGSPAYPLDEPWLRGSPRRRTTAATTRWAWPGSCCAIHASGDRTAALRQVQVPTAVVHGEDDPLVGVAGGRATAAAIPGAELLTIPGMGHNLPREVWPRLLDAVQAVADRADGR